MADDKKSGPPKAPAPSGWKAIDVVIILIVLASLLGALATSISNAFSGSGPTFFGVPISNFKDFFLDNSLLFKFISFFFSVLFLTFTIALSLLRGEVLKAERAKLFPQGESLSFNGPIPEPDDESKKRWKRIIENSESTSESNWRMAVIEADVMLDELLIRLGLPGDTMGDRLKAVERSDFLTLDDAWEAHKIRNQIAHSGSGFQLNQRETRQVISLYEKVFKEFYLI